jgi:Large ribosomal RNA subunit accumulation protein YceD
MIVAEPVPEFSRPIRADKVGRAPMHRRIEAGPAECARLAQRLGIAELKHLVAELALERGGGGRIDLTGEFEAELVQLCVVSLAPVPARIAERFSMELSDRPLDIEPEAAESVIALDGAEPPEPIRDGIIDLGEAVAQQLAVAIDPYPRAPGAVADWPGKESDDAGAAGGRQPFAALDAARKHRRNP